VKELVFLLLCSLFTIACINPASKLPEYGHVPSFKMTDSQGHPFDSSELANKVWVVDFIYTNCPGPCPLMTSKMHRLAQQLKFEQQAKNDSDVRLVSISVDPARDTPAVLNAYAHHFGGPTPQWIFLTGTPDTVHLLAHDVFKVGDIISRMDHSTRFMVVDKKGDVRGYYSVFDQDGMQSLLRDVSALR
jgi:cytochrome oxidase Cu insertion factor (SCO1/SenC/PrrC family)